MKTKAQSDGLICSDTMRTVSQFGLLYLIGLPVQHCVGYRSGHMMAGNTMVVQCMQGCIKNRSMRQLDETNPC